MAKIVIKSVEFTDRNYNTREKTAIWVDGVKIGEGYYGGEPEDNSRCRDYNWIEWLIYKTLDRLGHDVKIEDFSTSDDEEYENA